eukprot:GHVN01080631.1.p1 GENE.GHVN01080631.1~~GHVN01080631.1.p1  ORF type:complete len:196 (-),score=10.62 GHVN01080631.1:387-974(-)
MGMISYWLATKHVLFEHVLAISRFLSPAGNPAAEMGVDASSEMCCDVSPCLYVTRLCTAKEKQSQEAGEAVRKEVEKFIKYEVWGRPMRRSEIIDKFGHNAIWGEPAVIVQIKHVEKPEDLHKWKCRGVFHGHRMRRVQNNVRYFIEKGSCWIAVASLDSVRVIVTRALVFNRRFEKLDLESAYIQAKWPSYAES